MASSPPKGEQEHPLNSDYERYIWNEGVERFWCPKEYGRDAHLICVCGSFKFKIIYTASYETTGECLDCGLRDVVHSG